MILKEYQSNAVDLLLHKSTKLLEKERNRKLLFQAPTGSGKTVIMAEFLARLAHSISGQEFGLSVIWAAPRNLHTQSKKSLTKIYGASHVLECREFYELTNLYIDNNEILFLNWESINKRDKNIIMTRNERDFYLNKIIENTKARGNKLILVIDESHFSATSEISQKIISDLDPNLTIEVSATPATVNSIDDIVKIDRDEVISSGMIKKRLFLNEGYLNSFSNSRIVSEAAASEDELLIDHALKKRDTLLQKYIENNSNVNPLLLIQLPDNKINNEEQLKNKIESYLDTHHGINSDNGKLAIYLSEEKTNLENIVRNDSSVEVLIFKQAIALGWDCPRSQILVLFRESKSLTFSIQTMGRIMRMPEPNLGHYKDEALNTSFVFTNISEISIDEEIGNDYVSISTSRRENRYKNLNLLSFYNPRQREKTRLNPNFTRIFREVCKEFDLIKKIDLNANQVKVKYIADKISEDVDDLRNIEIKGEIERLLINEVDIQDALDKWIINNLSIFFPESRTLERVLKSFYGFFAENLSIDKQKDESEISRIILDSRNSQLFKTVLNLTEEKYKTFVNANIKSSTESFLWEIPEAISVSSSFHTYDFKRSIMQPFFADTLSGAETAFIKYLESNSNIDWWFRNGDQDATYFAVNYSDSTGDHPFYIDFIVFTLDKKIWLIDTKMGFTIDIGRDKNEGLRNYLESQKRNDLDGGLVSNSTKSYDGVWKIYRGKSQDLTSADLSNWNVLQL